MALLPVAVESSKSKGRLIWKFYSSKLDCVVILLCVRKNECFVSTFLQFESKKANQTCILYALLLWGITQHKGVEKGD